MQSKMDKIRASPAYRIKVKAACRAGVETSSNVLVSLQPGHEVVVLEQVANAAGVCRMRVATAGLEVEGWISNKPEIVEELQGPAAEYFNESQLRNAAVKMVLKSGTRRIPPKTSRLLYSFSGLVSSSFPWFRWFCGLTMIFQH